MNHHYDIKAIPAQYLGIILHALGKQALDTAGPVYSFLLAQKAAQDEAAPTPPPNGSAAPLAGPILKGGRKLRA